VVFKEIVSCVAGAGFVYPAKEIHPMNVVGRIRRGRWIGDRKGLARGTKRAAHEALVAGPHARGSEQRKHVDRFGRKHLSLACFVQNCIGNGEDLFCSDLQTEELWERCLDLTGGHPLDVHHDHVRVQRGQTPLLLDDKGTQIDPAYTDKCPIPASRPRLGPRGGLSPCGGSR